MDSLMESILLENNIPITKQQWVVLNLIKTNDGINQNELACYVNRDKTSVTRFISTLIKKEYLEKKSSAEDKRANTLHITKKGLEVIKQTTPIIKEAVLTLQKEVTHKEIENTINSLKKIQEKIIQIKNK